MLRLMGVDGQCEAWGMHMDKLAVPCHCLALRALSAPAAYMAVRPSSDLRSQRCGVPVPVAGDPARSLEWVMPHDLFSSLDSFRSACAGSAGFVIRDLTGRYRPADAVEVQLAPEQLLVAQLRCRSFLARLRRSTTSCGPRWVACRMRCPRTFIWTRKTASWTTSRCSGAGCVRHWCNAVKWCAIPFF